MMEIGRRTFNKLASVTAATSAISTRVLGASLDANTVRLTDGSVHPVSLYWYERNVVTAGVTKENEGRRLAILEIGNERPLTRKLRAELAALTDFRNINRAHKLLEGRDYREIFGANATVDQIHINRASKRCGCVLNFVFDHNERHVVDVAIHAHYPTKVCADHAYFGNDFKAQFVAVMQS